MTDSSDMKYLKNLVRAIPDSPYSWKMSSQKQRDQLIKELVDNRQKIMEMDLPMLIEGELYTIADGNDSEIFEALRSIRVVLMKKYTELKSNN